LNYQKKLLILIIVSAAIRLAFSCLTELSADEAYYWTWAAKLQWNYFDHPPAIAWLIRLTTANLLLNSELFVRLGAVICCGISTWLIFKLGALIKDLQTGWFAALLYNASVYCSLTAGSNSIPDSPQLIFWIAGIILLIKIARSANYMPGATRLWCLFGSTAGLCIMCKVHGVFLWLGAGLYVMALNRKWLNYRGIYLAAIITLLIVSPIIIWNVQNDFITYKFHSGRVGPAGAGLNLARFMKAIVEEAAGNNPINFVLIFISLYLALKGKIAAGKTEIRVLLFCSLPLIGLVLFFALFRETFALWSGPGYTCLLILPAIRLASQAKTKPTNFPVIIKWTLAYMVFVGLAQALTINYFPGTLSAQKEGPKTGAQDLTLDMYGWKDAGVKFDSLYRSDVAHKLMPAGAPVIVTNWFPAAAIEFYITSKTKQQIIGIGTIDDLHQYHWTNQYKKPLKAGDDAYFIVPSDAFAYRTSNEVYLQFSSYEPPVVFPQYRSGRICRYISIYRVRGYK
jgi:hypothetical protein